MSYAERFFRCLSSLSVVLLVTLTACGGGGGGSSPSPVGPSPLPTSPSTPGPTPTPGPSGSPGSTPTPGPSGSPGSTPTPRPSGAPSPTPTPTGAAVVLSPSSLSFTPAWLPAPGQIVSVAQAQNVGGFTLSTTNCAGIASATPTTGAGPFTIVPLAVGTCSYLVTGNDGSASALSITVTTTTLNNN